MDTAGRGGGVLCIVISMSPAFEMWRLRTGDDDRGTGGGGGGSTALRLAIIEWSKLDSYASGL